MSEEQTTRRGRGRTHRKARAICLLLPLVTTMLGGCLVAAALEGRPGTDLGRIIPGLSRAEVEGVLGPPLRTWTTPAGVDYRIYSYDVAVPPSRGEAAANLLLDLLSLGLWELLAGTSQSPAPVDKRQIAVAYDSAANVVGVFDRVTEPDQLPADGRPMGAKTERP